MEARFREFIASRRWVTGSASVVNQRHDEGTCTKPGDLPLWDLGITLPLPDPGAELAGWFADLEAIAQVLGTLHRECGRDFVVAIADAETNVTHAFFTVVRTLVGNPAKVFGWQLQCPLMADSW